MYVVYYAVAISTPSWAHEAWRLPNHDYNVPGLEREVWDRLLDHTEALWLVPGTFNVED